MSGIAFACFNPGCPERKPVPADRAPTCYTCGSRMTGFDIPVVELSHAPAEPASVPAPEQTLGDVVSMAELSAAIRRTRPDRIRWSKYPAFEPAPSNYWRSAAKILKFPESDMWITSNPKTGDRNE